jgi:hypothetical protein
MHDDDTRRLACVVSPNPFSARRRQIYIESPDGPPPLRQASSINS